MSDREKTGHTSGERDSWASNDLAGNSKNKENKSLVAFLALFFLQSGQCKGCMSPVSNLILPPTPMAGGMVRVGGGRLAIWQRIFTMPTQEQCTESECRFSAGLGNGTESILTRKGKIKGF